MALIDRVEACEARAGVLGLGYVGLPFACAVAILVEAGWLRLTGLGYGEPRKRSDGVRGRVISR